MTTSGMKSYTLKPALVVYQSVNLITGERYIGCTSHPLEVRAWQHYTSRGTARASGPFFSKALEQFDIEFFRWSVVAECQTTDEMYSLERSLIKAWRPAYNVLKRTRRKASPETIAKLKVARRTQAATDAARERWRKHVQPKCVPAKRKPVIDLQTGEIYESMTEAAKAIGRLPSNFTKAVKRGVRWKFLETEGSA